MKRILMLAAAVCIMFCVPFKACASDLFDESSSPFMQSETPPSELGPTIAPEPASDAVPSESPAYTSNLVITSYQITDENGKTLSTLSKGKKATVSLKIKDSGIKTEQIMPSDIKDPAKALDISHLVDSFSENEETKIELLSKAGEPFEAKVVFTSAKYSGVGKEFRFMAGYRLIDVPYNTLSLTVTECEEYTEPDTAPDPAAPPAAPTPGIIIQKYSYGESKVAAGNTFPLSITFQNTSRSLKVENITMSLETDEGLSITSSSNSFYFTELGPEKTITQSLDMLAIDGEKITSTAVGINFKYEYVDKNERHSVTAAEKISIPVYQPVRFEVTEPAVPTDISAGNEVILSLPYVNKGKGTIYNVSATLEGEVNVLIPTQNLGNFESGKSGSIDFIFTPENPGDVEITLHVSYENASAQLQALDFPIKMTVGEAVADPGDIEDFPGDYPEFPEENNGPSPLLWGVMGMAGIAAAAAVIIVKIKKRREKAKHAADDPFLGFQWEDQDEGE